MPLTVHCTPLLRPLDACACASPLRPTTQPSISRTEHSDRDATRSGRVRTHACSCLRPCVDPRPPSTSHALEPAPPNPFRARPHRSRRRRQVQGCSPAVSQSGIAEPASRAPELRTDHADREGGCLVAGGSRIPVRPQSVSHVSQAVRLSELHRARARRSNPESRTRPLEHAERGRSPAGRRRALPAHAHAHDRASARACCRTGLPHRFRSGHALRARGL
ncbi:hypothetical protein B0H10DRAFT_2006823, partial [Mycena sp. CBHHK59/15]